MKTDDARPDYAALVRELPGWCATALPENEMPGGSAERCGDETCIPCRAAAAIEALVAERKVLELKARLVDRLPFCPDHRDKVAGKACRECEVEELVRENVELRGRAEHGRGWAARDE